LRIGQIVRMDSNWFQEALLNSGQTQADLARYLGLPPSAVSRMLRGERQMKLSEAVQTAAFLGASQEEILRHAGDMTSAAAPHEPRRRGRPPLNEQRRPSSPVWGDNIPIRRTGDGAQLTSDQPIGFTPRPANLAGVLGAYAVYTEGETLSPRYEPGWLLHVHPHKPPTRGRDVVVLRKGGTVLIKQFVGWNDEALEVRQLNPAATEHIPRDDVLACHLIVGVDQEG
jgi:transcriptional regulator with XRE-family HTH domain